MGPLKRQGRKRAYNMTMNKFKNFRSSPRFSFIKTILRMLAKNTLGINTIRKRGR
jgi:hypothetical protein